MTRGTKSKPSERQGMQRPREDVLRAEILRSRLKPRGVQARETMEAPRILVETLQERAAVAVEGHRTGRMAPEARKNRETPGATSVDLARPGWRRMRSGNLGGRTFGVRCTSPIARPTATASPPRGKETGVWR